LNSSGVLTGISELSGYPTPMSAFPNPTQGTLEFDAALEGSECMIFNDLGQYIQTSFIENRSIHLNNLPSGIYIVHVSSAQGLKLILTVLKDN